MEINKYHIKLISSLSPLITTFEFYLKHKMNEVLGINDDNGSLKEGGKYYQFIKDKKRNKKHDLTLGFYSILIKYKEIEKGTVELKHITSDEFNKIFGRLDIKEIEKEISDMVNFRNIIFHYDYKSITNAINKKRTEEKSIHYYFRIIRKYIKYFAGENEWEEVLGISRYGETYKGGV